MVSASSIRSMFRRKPSRVDARARDSGGSWNSGECEKLGWQCIEETKAQAVTLRPAKLALLSRLTRSLSWSPSPRSSTPSSSEDTKRDGISNSKATGRWRKSWLRRLKEFARRASWPLWPWEAYRLHAAAVEKRKGKRPAVQKPSSDTPKKSGDGPVFPQGDGTMDLSSEDLRIATNVQKDFDATNYQVRQYYIENWRRALIAVIDKEGLRVPRPGGQGPSAGARHLQVQEEEIVRTKNMIIAEIGWRAAVTLCSQQSTEALQEQQLILIKELTCESRLFGGLPPSWEGIGTTIGVVGADRAAFLVPPA
ncbi:MAG: hypothetical protein M1817_000361 [Caeruleum heppii]|nr:MAG: hypothetical protein M1817_000361 [Caeruleum heppii]